MAKTALPDSFDALPDLPESFDDLPDEQPQATPPKTKVSPEKKARIERAAGLRADLSREQAETPQDSGGLLDYGQAVARNAIGGNRPAINLNALIGSVYDYATIPEQDSVLGTFTARQHENERQVGAAEERSPYLTKLVAPATVALASGLAGAKDAAGKVAQVGLREAAKQGAKTGGALGFAGGVANTENPSNLGFNTDTLLSGLYGAGPGAAIGGLSGAYSSLRAPRGPAPEMSSVSATEPTAEFQQNLSQRGTPLSPASTPGAAPGSLWDATKEGLSSFGVEGLQSLRTMGRAGSDIGARVQGAVGLADAARSGLNAFQRVRAGVTPGSQPAGGASVSIRPAESGVPSLDDIYQNPVVPGSTAVEPLLIRPNEMTVPQDPARPNTTPWQGHGDLGPAPIDLASPFEPVQGGSAVQASPWQTPDIQSSPFTGSFEPVGAGPAPNATPYAPPKGGFYRNPIVPGTTEVGAGPGINATPWAKPHNFYRNPLVSGNTPVEAGPGINATPWESGGDPQSFIDHLYTPNGPTRTPSAGRAPLELPEAPGNLEVEDVRVRNPNEVRGKRVTRPAELGNEEAPAQGYEGTYQPEELGTPRAPENNMRLSKIGVSPEEEPSPIAADQSRADGPRAKRGSKRTRDLNDWEGKTDVTPDLNEMIRESHMDSLVAPEGQTPSGVLVPDQPKLGTPEPKKGMGPWVAKHGSPQEPINLPEPATTLDWNDPQVNAAVGHAAELAITRRIMDPRVMLQHLKPYGIRTLDEAKAVMSRALRD